MQKWMSCFSPKNLHQLACCGRGIVSEAWQTISWPAVWHSQTHHHAVHYSLWQETHKHLFCWITTEQVPSSLFPTVTFQLADIVEFINHMTWLSKRIVGCLSSFLKLPGCTSLCNLSGLKEHRHSRASDSKLSDYTTMLKSEIFWEK